MKKTNIIAIIAIIAVVGVLFIAPVQTFAVNAMGIFRASDPNVIYISAQDIADITQNVQTLISAHKQQDTEAQTSDQAKNSKPGQDGQSPADMLAQYEKTLGSASDFTAFSFSLPTYLKDQTPEITEIDMPPQTITVDTAKVNEALSELQSQVTLPDNFNGRKVTITPSPMVVAQYSDAICFAMQKPSFDWPGRMETTAAQIITTLPLLTDNIRSQLGNIDLFDKNIYLPNVEGITKTVDLGGNTGYIYAVDDISRAIPASIPQDSNLTQAFQKYSGYEAVLWVNNGTLYGVAGKYTDDQLSAIARTMK